MRNHPPRKRRERRLFARANDIIYAHDLSGNFTFLNKAGELLTGYSCEEARGMNIAELVAPELVEDVQRRITRKVRERLGTVDEIEIIAKDGRRVPLEVSTRIILRNGQPLEIQGLAVPSVLRSDHLHA